MTPAVMDRPAGSTSLPPTSIELTDARLEWREVYDAGALEPRYVGGLSGPSDEESCLLSDDPLYNFLPKKPFEEVFRDLSAFAEGGIVVLSLVCSGVLQDQDRRSSVY